MALVILTCQQQTMAEWKWPRSLLPEIHTNKSPWRKWIDYVRDVSTKYKTENGLYATDDDDDDSLVLDRKGGEVCLMSIEMVQSVADLPQTCTWTSESQTNQRIQIDE